METRCIIKQGYVLCLICFLTQLASCSEQLDNPDKRQNFVTAYLGTEIVDTSYFDYAKGVENAQKKARHIAEIKWRAKGDIPKWESDVNSFYYGGKAYKGIPYSSVKQIDTYVGHNVSFYTFMSAVSNPKSRLYTEDLSGDPYNGVHCATYYGTVCSMSVNYALGIEAPFICRDYPSIGFEQVVPQDVDAIQVCDVVWRSGHVMMVYDVARDSHTNSVERVSIFEVNSVREYSRQDFINKWKDGEYSILRYRYVGGNLSYTPNLFVLNEGESQQSVVFNPDLCPDKGDKACYRVGEDVFIDVLNPACNLVDIREENGAYVAQLGVVDGKCYIQNLPYGIYTARGLLNGGAWTQDVSFEIVDANMYAHPDAGKIVVNFSSGNAVPRYVILCKENGGKYALKQFSDAERLAGRTELVAPDANEYYVKVAFEGEYGIITNTPVLVSRL